MDRYALEDDEKDSDGLQDDFTYSEHIYLGSPKKPITVADVATLSASRSFRDFCKKLTLFLNDFLPQANIPIPGGTGIVIVRETDKVSISYSLSAPAAFLLLCTQLQEFRYLKVNYESHVDWKTATDYLRCNPNFHGHERYDCALVRITDRLNNDKVMVVRLQFMFEYTIGEATLRLVLVMPLDFPTGKTRAIDEDLRLIRLRTRAAASSQIIPLRSIIRGALLVPDFARDGDYFLVNYIDSDMFLRSQTLTSE